ncbi:MAG: hypothetical protein ACI82H_000786 [Alphaproteobacteria bacterium]|jgi:hypothetical protein
MGKKEESTMMKRLVLKQLAFAALLGFGFATLAPAPAQAGNSFGISIGSHGRLEVTAANGYDYHRGHRRHSRPHSRRHSRRHSRPHYSRGYSSSIAVFFGSGAVGYGHHDSYPYTAKHTVRYLHIRRLVAGVRAGTFACYRHVTHRHAVKRLRLSPHRLKNLYESGHGDSIRCHAIH